MAKTLKSMIQNGAYPYVQNKKGRERLGESIITRGDVNSMANTT
jgi:hypothetical protein